VLTRFLDEAYPALDAAEQEAFEALLNEQDPDLARWIWGGDAPPDAWRSLIRRIQIASGISSAE